MIGLHDHHRAHSTRVARTVEKTFASFSPGHCCDANAASIEIVQLLTPSVPRHGTPRLKRGWALGTSRNAVIGRSRRLREIVYQSDIDSWTRANARR